MKNHFNCTLLLLFVFSVTGFAQINFEKGYFINRHPLTGISKKNTIEKANISHRKSIESIEKA